MNQLFTRRDVIKTVLVSTATSIIGNKAWAAKSVSEVAQSVDPTVGVARINLASFPALNNNGGSVRLSSSGASLESGRFKPIIISRVSATEYTVLDSECTHEGCVVNAFVGTPVNGRLTCPCHGSQFNIQGNVTQGPAGAPLFKYDYTLANGVMAIQLLDYGFSVTQTKVLNGAQERLELAFPSFSGTQYEVRHRANLAANTTVQPFATTLAGNPTTQFTGGNNATRRIYIVPQDGIYQVAIRLTQA